MRAKTDLLRDLLQRLTEIGQECDHELLQRIIDVRDDILRVVKAIEERAHK